MKVIVTRRELQSGVGLLRRASSLVRWLAADGRAWAAPGPEPEGVRGWGSSPPEIDRWEAWLAAHRERLPGDLLPPAGQEHVYGIILAVVSLPKVERMATRDVGRVRDLLIQCVVALVSGREPAERRTPAGMLRERVARVVDSATTRDDAGLYTLAWRAALEVRAGGHAGDGPLRFLWRTVGHALEPRPTFDDVWRARRRLIQAV